MADAPSLDSISANLAHTLEPYVDFQLEPILDFESSPTTGFARTGLDFSELKFTSTRVTIDQVSKLAGILFCSPDTDFGKREVLPHLDQFDQRSEDFVEFYCAGFGTTQLAGDTNEGRFLPVVAGHKWWYSTKAFNSLRKELEGKTRWKYSGETDLILFTASRNASGVGYISFSPSLVCNLEQMSKDGAFTSVRAFLEAIARLGEEYEGRDPVSLLSKKQEKKVGGNILKTLVLSILPKAVQEGYRKAEHLAFQDISK